MVKVVVLLILVLFALWVWFTIEPRTLYHPDAQLVATPAVLGLLFEDVTLTTADGTRIHAWFIPAPKFKIPNPKSTMTVLLCHGNAGNISHRLDKVTKWHALGWDVLLFDYRGYGRSEGKPTEKGTYQDAEAAYQYLVQTRLLAPTRIVLYGESLGGAVALQTALAHPVAALILESAFTSTVDMGKLVFPWLPVRWMVRYQYDNLSKVTQLKIPLLVLHSPEDEIIPFVMGKALYDAAPGTKRFIELRGDHNGGYDLSGDIYIRGIREFLQWIKNTNVPSGH